MTLDTHRILEAVAVFTLKTESGYIFVDKSYDVFRRQLWRPPPAIVRLAKLSPMIDPDQEICLDDPTEVVESRTFLRHELSDGLCIYVEDPTP